MNYSLSYQVGRVLCAIEFWVFVLFREIHVFHWSWWWLVVFQASYLIGMAVDKHKAEKS